MQVKKFLAGLSAAAFAASMVSMVGASADEETTTDGTVTRYYNSSSDSSSYEIDAENCSDYIISTSEAAEAGTYEWTLDFSSQVYNGIGYYIYQIYNGEVYYIDEIEDTDGDTTYNYGITDIDIDFTYFADNVTATLDKITLYDADGNVVYTIANDDNSALLTATSEDYIYDGYAISTDLTAEQLESVTSVVATVTTDGYVEGTVGAVVNYDSDVVLFAENTVYYYSNENAYIVISKEKFANAEVGDTIEIKWYGDIDYDEDSETTFISSLILTSSGAEDSAFANATYSLDSSSDAVTSITLTEDMLAELQEYGLTINADGYAYIYYFALLSATDDSSSSEETSSTEDTSSYEETSSDEDSTDADDDTDDDEDTDSDDDDSDDDSSTTDSATDSTSTTTTTTTTTSDENAATGATVAFAGLGIALAAGAMIVSKKK
ncbi:MAG: hypothetical protein LUE12_09595 [Ruminococcus sp.]|nr:hypothetical protein [Ruminococcus sp.]